MRKGFLIYEEMRKYFLIYEEAISHIWLCNCSTLNFLKYEENLIFFFISASTGSPLSTSVEEQLIHRVPFLQVAIYRFSTIYQCRGTTDSQSSFPTGGHLPVLHYQPVWRNNCFAEYLSYSWPSTGSRFSSIAEEQLIHRDLSYRWP